MRIPFVFSHHAAMRWFERCNGLDFAVEMSRINRDRTEEKRRASKGYRFVRIYKTSSGVKLFVDGLTVVTVI